MWWLVLVLLTLLFYYIFYSITDIFGYWKKRGIPHPKFSYIFGNMGDAMKMKKNMGLVLADIYRDYPNLKYVGIYKFRTPTLLIRDPELIKDILSKEFNSFHDNEVSADTFTDVLLAKNPFVLKGEEWKTVRSQLTPFFTTGKLKPYLPLTDEICKLLVAYVEKEINSRPNEPLEVKELCSRYAIDNIATCAFGLEGNSLKEPKWEFFELGTTLVKPSFIMAMKFLLVTLVPALTKMFKVNLFSEKASRRLRDIIIETLKYRRDNKITRNDFLHMMNELKQKSVAYKFTDNDIVSHAAGFLIDGFETSSVAIAFTLYQLGKNPDIQTKLREEIVSTISQNEGKVTYEVIQQMQYLDNVLSESLRLHSPGLHLMKECTSKYTLEPPMEGGSSLVVEPGTPIMIPLYGLHYDPKYFPDPDRFNPDRFSPENRQKLTKYTYLPFGEGPRGCLGQKFAVLQAKMAIIYLVKHFQLRVNSKTKSPIEIDPNHFMLSAKGGLWLNFQKINNL